MAWKILIFIISIGFHISTSNAKYSLQKCLSQFILKQHYIIDTKASLEAGANFINVYDAKNARSCSKICCRLQTCTVVIYEIEVQSKRDHKNCFAFNCGPDGSLCTFASHNNFLALISTPYNDQDPIESNFYDDTNNADNLILREIFFDAKKPLPVRNTTKLQPTTSTPKTTTQSPLPKIPSTSAQTPAQSHPTPPKSRSHRPFLIPANYDYQQPLYVPIENPDDSVYQQPYPLIFPTALGQPAKTREFLPRNVTNLGVYNGGRSLGGARYRSAVGMDASNGHVRKTYVPDTQLSEDLMAIYPTYTGIYHRPQDVYAYGGTTDQRVLPSVRLGGRTYPGSYMPGARPHFSNQMNWMAGYGRRGERPNDLRLVDDDQVLVPQSPSPNVPARVCNPSYEFQCESGDPACIAIYDVCDRIPHCQDGSDERDCPRIQSKHKPTSAAVKDLPRPAILVTDGKMGGGTNNDSLPGDKGKDTGTSDASGQNSVTQAFASVSRDRRRATLAFGLGLCLLFSALTVTCLTCASRLVKPDPKTRPSARSRNRFYIDGSNGGLNGPARRPLMQSDDEGGAAAAPYYRTEPGRVLADDADQLMDGPDPLDLDMHYGTAEDQTTVIDPAASYKRSVAKLGAALTSKRNYNKSLSHNINIPNGTTHNSPNLYTG